VWVETKRYLVTMNSVVINYSKGKPWCGEWSTRGLLSCGPRLGQEAHHPHRIRISVIKRVHDSIGPVPVNSGTQSKPQGLTAPEDEEPFSKTRCEAEPSHVEPGL